MSSRYLSSPRLPILVPLSLAEFHSVPCRLGTWVPAQIRHVVSHVNVLYDLDQRQIALLRSIDYILYILTTVPLQAES